MSTSLPPVSAPPVSQTRAFVTIWLIELWERFGYYGMAAILVLYMVEKVGFHDAQANLVWGAFTALVYAAPAIGGWIGDNVLGTRRTMPIGAAILALGYFMLSVPSDNLYFLYVSMGVISRRERLVPRPPLREHGSAHLRGRRR